MDLGCIVELSKARKEARDAKILEIKARITDHTLLQGFELSSEDLDEAAAFMWRREALVGLLKGTTPWSDRWNELSKEIVMCEAGMANVDSRLI